MSDRQYTIDPNNMSLLDSIRTVGGHVAAGIADIPALPARLYKLANEAVKIIPPAVPILGPVAAGARTIQEDGKLPGYQGADEFDKDVSGFAHQVGSDVAGRELKVGLLSNDPAVTTADRIGTGASILTNMIPITGGPIKRGMEAVEQIKTGIKYVDEAIPVLTNAASFLSPLVPTTSPKAIIAANAAIGGALVGGADLIQNELKPTEELVFQDTEKFLASMNAAADVTQQQIKAGVDTSVDGVGKGFDAKKDLDGFRSAAEFIAENSGPIKPVKAGFDFGEYQAAAGAVAGITLAGAAAYVGRNAVRGKMLEYINGKEFGSIASKDAVSKPNGTNLGLFDTFKAQTMDSSVPLQRESSNPEKIRGLFEQQTVASNVHFTTLHSEGVFAGNSNVKLSRPLVEIVEDFKVTLGSDPAKRQLYIDTANALAERDNRVTAWLESGSRPTLSGKKIAVDDPIAVNEYSSWLVREKAAVKPNPATYSDEIAKIEGKHAFNTFDPTNGIVKTFKDLSGDIRKGMADPDIARLINSYKDVTRQSLRYMLEQKAITKKEFIDLARFHPNYFPVRVEGKHMSPLELSSIGGRLHRGDPISELFPFIEETVRSVANTKLKTAFVEDVLARAKAGDVRAKELVGRTDIRADQINKHNKDKLTIWRDKAGNPHVVEFRDPLVRHALSGNAGTAAVRMTEGAMKAFAFPARMTEQVNTGPLTAFVGSAFAPIGAAYGTGAVLINRPAGTVAGVIDRAFQDVSKSLIGKPIGFRGDPTFILQVGQQMLANSTAILAKNAAGAIEAAMKTSWMKGASSNASLDALAKSMSNFYKASTVHAMEQRGLYGGATPTVTRTAPTMKELENALSPTVFASEGWKNTRNFVHDILGAIGNAPQAAYYKQNLGRMPIGNLTTRTRNVLGDPAKSGLATSGVGKFGVGMTTVTPWGNVAVQSLVALAESFKKNPHGTAWAVVATVGIPSMLISNWNAVAGPEYVKYQFMTRTPDQAAGSHYVAIPGLPPEQGLEIPVDQPMRPFKVLTDILYGFQTGLADGSLFKPENERMKESFIDAMKTRYYGGPMSNAMSAAVGSALPPLPSMLNVATAALGFDQVGRNYVDSPTSITPVKGAGATDSTSKTVDNKWFGMNVSAEFEAVFNSLGGQVARAVSDTLTGAFGGSAQGLSSSDIKSDMGEKFGMRVDKSTRMFGGLWGRATNTISPSQEAVSRSLQEQKEGLLKLEAASEKLRSAFGSGETLTGAKSRGFDALTGPGPVQFKDAEMKELAWRAQYFMNRYNVQYAGKIKSLYEERNSALSSEKLSPRIKQEMVNGISKEIIEMNHKALSAVEQWKWLMSKQFNRDIDLRKIKLGEPITQFKPLLPQ